MQNIILFGVSLAVVLYLWVFPVVNFLFWRVVAWTVTRPIVRQWLMARAVLRPYTHIPSRVNEDDIYMFRYWLFNPYPESGAKKRWGWNWLPSIRLHWIMRPDEDRDLHDHPWNARTIILSGWYRETREGYWMLRQQGDTATLNFGEFHRIDEIAEFGVLTLFITWRYQGTWGFKVAGKKIPWRVYLDRENS